MNIAKILDKKNNEKKLDLIVELVASARKKYNNEDAEIPAPTVGTCAGGQNIKYVSVEDKAALATQALRSILCDINVLDESTPGVNVNKELTSMIATSPVLTNLEASLSLGLE